MIQAHALSRWYGHVLAVDSLDFKIPRGQVVGFLGPNGAGKSTTIRMIAGYLPPSSGRVEVGGVDVNKHRRSVAYRIGYLPESTPLYTEMRVADFLRFRAKLFGIRRARRKAAVDLAVKRCWLDQVQRRPISQLSKGYRQRVGLAAALLHDPAVLILDEPTVGLDPSQVRELRSLIRELRGSHTILLSTHILPEVELTCDRIIMMARGRIQAMGTIDELRAAAAETCRYVIETDSNRAYQVLSSMQGVTQVDGINLDHGWRRLTVTTARGTPDARERFSKKLQEAGAGVRELRREAPSLEQMFVRMTAAAELTAGDRSAAERQPPWTDVAGSRQP
jgi:ABC-2 type transport system ATP-binding protein